MRDKNLLQRSPVAWLALGITLAAGFAACSDDDSGVSPDGGAAGSIAHDATSGNTGGTTGKDASPDVVTKDTGTPDTGADVVTTDGAQGGSAAPDANAPDTGSGGATGTGGAGGAGGASHAGGNSDAGVGGHEAGPDAEQAEAASPDGGGDAQPDAIQDAGPLPPLSLCAWLDAQFTPSAGLPAECDTKTTDDCAVTRAYSWIDAFWYDFPATDCRILGTIKQLTPTEFNTWNTDVNTWTYFFFGCPLDPTEVTLPSQFGLVPRADWDSWTYTSADLQAFGQVFIDHARAVLADTTYVASATDFSAADLVKIQDRMNYLINAYEHSKSSSSAFSWSWCSTDGGDGGGEQ